MWQRGHSPSAQPQIEAALGHRGSRSVHGAIGPGQESADVDRVRPGQVPTRCCVRFRLAAVIVAPVLKFTTPESIVRLPSGPTVLPAVKTTLAPSLPPVSIRVAPLTLYVLPEAKLADTPEPNVTEPAPLIYAAELKAYAS